MTIGRGTSYWLYGGFQLPAVELVPCCRLVHTPCPSAASPRSLRPGWPLPAVCAGSAAHTETHRHTHHYTAAMQCNNIF